jgi:hypothetical protein
VSARRIDGDGASRLIAVRRPSRTERRNGAEIVFVRRLKGRNETICAAVCYESWQQWGAPQTVLADNVVLVERWRRGDLAGFSPTPDD